MYLLECKILILFSLKGKMMFVQSIENNILYIIKNININSRLFVPSFNYVE